MARTGIAFMPNLPIGRTDEVLVHPRDNDLILATHSRSVWIMDDVAALQRLTPDALAKPSVLFPTRDAVRGRPIAESARRSRATIGGWAKTRRAAPRSLSI